MQAFILNSFLAVGLRYMPYLIRYGNDEARIKLLFYNFNHTTSLISFHENLFEPHHSPHALKSKGMLISNYSQQRQLNVASKIKLFIGKKKIEIFEEYL